MRLFLERTGLIVSTPILPLPTPRERAEAARVAADLSIGVEEALQRVQRKTIASADHRRRFMASGLTRKQFDADRANWQELADALVAVGYRSRDYLGAPGTTPVLTEEAA